MPSLRDDSGLTLTELLVVSVLISVILSAAFMMFNAASSMNDIATARANASDEAQAAIDLMSRELRQAQEDNPNAAGVFYISGANEMKFSTDLNGDLRPELVRYYVESGSLKRTVAAPASTVPTFTYASPGPATVLVRELGTSAGPLFCYHSRVVDTNVTCGPSKHGFAVVSTTSPRTYATKIAMVGIKLDVIGSSGMKDTPVISRALVRMRTTENLLE